MIPALNKKYPFYIISFGVLFLFLALRYDFGNDYMNYYNTHELINGGFTAWGDTDVLYKYLNLLVPNFYLLVSILSLFYILIIMFLIKKNLLRTQYWFAVFILLINPYLFLVHLSSLRQTIAICFVIVAVHFITKKNILLYFLFVFLAIGFHQSALIMLPAYFLLNKNKIKKGVTLLIVGAAMLLLFTPLSDVLISKVLEYFPNRYSYYYEQGNQNSIRATILSSFFFFIILFNINKLNEKEIIYGKLSLIATFISLLAYKVSMITRIGMYFDIFLIVTLPVIFYKIENKKVKIILFIIMVIIFILRYLSFFNSDLWGETYKTYQTILMK